MTHLSDEQLILHYYRENPEEAPAEPHLEECADCRDRFASLQRTLNVLDGLPVPDRGPEYSQSVWEGLQSRVSLRRKSRWTGFHRWAFAGALGAVVLLAFLAGRFSTNPTERPQLASNAPQVRERVLLVALGDHLERSQRVLVELSNVGPEALDGTRAEAEDLLASNRLYRQAAVRDDEPGLASVLDELERLLADVAHSSDDDWEQIRQRMADQGILFKVRVIESNVRQREKDGLPVMRY